MRLQAGEPFFGCSLRQDVGDLPLNGVALTEHQDPVGAHIDDAEPLGERGVLHGLQGGAGDGAGFHAGQADV